MRIFNDLLKTTDPEKGEGKFYSQSRVYLFLTFVAMILLTAPSIFITFDNKNFQVVYDTLFWTLALFASYALFKKGMKHQEIIGIAKARANVSDSIKEKIASATKTIKDEMDNQELS